MDTRSRTRNFLSQIVLLWLVGCSSTDIPTEPPVDQPDDLIVKVELDYSKVPEKCRDIVDLMISIGSENNSRFMGQIEQESSCNIYALSRTGAIGLVQIMPDTLEWGARTFARVLGKPDPNNPRYAIEFLKLYMEFFTLDQFDDYCSNKRVDEQRYNGGMYIIWEIEQSDGTIEGARALCGTQRLLNGKMRSLSNCHENYEYPNYNERRAVKYYPIGGKQCN